MAAAVSTISLNSTTLALPSPRHSLATKAGGAGASPRSSEAPSPAASGGAGVPGTVLKGRLAPTEFPRAHISSCTKIGKRKTQEDRCTIIPKVNGNPDCVFLGVFDGTVGDTAADYVHHSIADNIIGSQAYKEAVSAGTAEGSFLAPVAVKKIEEAFLDGYRATDSALIRLCAAEGIHYSSCTSVTALLTRDLLTTAHLGDSKIVIGKEVSGGVQGKYLTQDHKPDMPDERRRIESSGGSLTYLHGGKPFIRGGDFLARQAKGERPMQLNYSRAFGGKDLKMFGLSAVPDVLHVPLTPADRVLILASDGLWDVVSADVSVKRAWDSWRAGRDPALDLTDYALQQHDLRGSVDNVTVVVAILK